ncbi:hypothetical protein TWF103_007082 [Orbilia oligospora]|nr:hypothetical protein TWF103_007082 [Orbilia oligospora]
MIAQFLRTAFRPNTMWSTSRFVPEKTAPSEMRTFSSLQTPTPKTFTIFGTEYSRKRVLLADMAIFDYYYFFASKKTGN